MSTKAKPLCPVCRRPIAECEQEMKPEFCTKEYRHHHEQAQIECARFANLQNPKITLEEVSTAKRNLEREIFARIEEFEKRFGIKIQDARLFNDATVSVLKSGSNPSGASVCLARLFCVRVDL